LQDGHQGIPRGLVGQVVKVSAAQVGVRSAASTDLEAGGAEQKLV
jgi:hypothetical protein